MHSDLHLPSLAPQLQGTRWSSFFKLPATLLWGCGAVFFVSFANLISLANEDGDTTTGLDAQSIAKLGLVACLGLYSVQRMWGQPGMLSLMFGAPGIFLTGIVGWLMLTSLISASPLVSFASALASGACIWGGMGAGLQLGPERVLRICGWACLGFLLGSWGLWLLDREAATFLEPIDNGEFVPRFGGLSHPNAVGQLAGLTVLAGCLLYGRTARTKSAWIAVAACVGVGLLSLMACGSRTSILALLLSLGFAFRSRLLRGKLLGLGIVSVTLGLGFLVALSTEPTLGRKVSERLVKTISKSGTTEELASGTGRSQIWAESLRLIKQRPWTGYGAATSKELLADFTRYTHNMILNVGLSGGILPMALLVGAFAFGFYSMARSPCVVPDTFLIFIFLNGLAENVCFLVLDSAPMVILTTALIWRKVSEARAEIGNGAWEMLPGGQTC